MRRRGPWRERIASCPAKSREYPDRKSDVVSTMSAECARSDPALPAAGTQTNCAALE